MLLLAAAAVRRFLPRPSARGCSATLRTIYDGANAWADFGNTNVLQTRYLYTRAMDEVLARLSSTSILAWDLPDILGSVRDISDGAGTAVLDHVKYDSYGNTLIETAPAQGDRFKYTAREWDAATNQYFYRARYYNSGAGRFASQDPIGFAGGDANVSRYAANSPTLVTDPNGLDWHHLIPQEFQGLLISLGVLVNLHDKSNGLILNPALHMSLHDGRTYNKYVKNWIMSQRNLTVKDLERFRKTLPTKFPILKQGIPATKNYLRGYGRVQKLLRKLPVVAPILAILTFPSKVQAKGIIAATVDTGLDFTPLGTIKAVGEFVSGTELIPDLVPDRMPDEPEPPADPEEIRYRGQLQRLERAEWMLDAAQRGLRTAPSE